MKYNRQLIHSWSAVVNRMAKLDDCPDEYYSLLRSAQFEADRIYSKLSVSLIRVAIDISWLAALGSLSCLCGVFVTFQRRRQMPQN
jgi:hypothetical protein